MSFIKRVEDFICEHCKKKVIGTGYTNHCPYCLWSKHVDIHPGDRAASCRGMMKPIGIEIKKNETYVLLTCVICGHSRPNKTCLGDSQNEIIQLSVVTLK